MGAQVSSGGLLLLAMLLLPLAGALAVAPMRSAPSTAKATALAFALAELVFAALAWRAFEPGAGRLQLGLSVEWIPEFGARFALGVDGIALVMIALIGVLVPIVMGSSWEEKLPEGRTAAGFYSLLLTMQSMMVGVFAATDVFLFYLFFEVMLVPMYFLIGRFGGPRRQYAAVKFFLYSLLGGLVMLASVIGVFVVSSEELGQGTFDWATLVTIADDIPESVQIWLFLGFFLAFAIKAPLVPLHTWLPDAGAEAPVGAGVLLVGVLDKVGVYGFLRYCLPLFPDASRRLAPIVLVLAVVGVVYGALLAVGQSDMKRFVAYTSVAHFGFIALGIFAFSTQAHAGAVLYMVNHGISTGMLFIVLGMVIARGGSRAIADYGGVAKLAPVLAGMLLLAGLSLLSLPGTNTFVSEFLVLLGSYPRQPVFTIIATCGIILAALYVLWVYQRMMTGPLRGAAVLGDEEAPRQPALAGPGAATDPEATRRRAAAAFPDLSKREVGVLAPLVLLILLLGFYPQPVLEVINPSVEATMSEAGFTDPVGSTGGGQGGN
ncbi:MAG: NADH-quinone oxidoreductase subunit M [Pseudonocardiaceae bacterium]|nr:NADH-quinone oxidoreductase subunit M [Pseudonocardiaceae bacterium]